MHHKLSAKDFIAHETGIEALQHASEIVIDDERIANHTRTTNEIRECCKDIKVLGRKDLRLLLSWWKHLKEEFNKKFAEENEASNAEGQEEDENVPLTLEEVEDMEDGKISEEIDKIREEESKELKRKRKKANKERQKLNEKLNLKMVLKGDEGPVLEGDDMFTLKEIQTLDHLKTVTDQTPDVLAESEDEEETILPKKVRYEKESGHLDSSGLYYKSDESNPEDSDDDESVSDKSGLGLSGSEDESEKPKVQPKRKRNLNTDNNPLITDLDPRDKKTKRVHKAELWFAKDIFKNLEDEKDEDFELDKMVEVLKKGGVVVGEEKSEKKSKKTKSKVQEEEDSDYDVEEVMTQKKKVQKVGGKDGYEVAAKEKRKLIKDIFYF